MYKFNVAPGHAPANGVPYVPHNGIPFAGRDRPPLRRRNNSMLFPLPRSNSLQPSLSILDARNGIVNQQYPPEADC
ncbi:MAG: hypothetical protein AAB562_04550, partial [Patescibacteria group bacterium]